jgi:hypothetical protein
LWILGIEDLGKFLGVDDDFVDVAGFDFVDFGEVVVDEFAQTEDFKPGGFIDAGDFELDYEKDYGFFVGDFFESIGFLEDFHEVFGGLF